MNDILLYGLFSALAVFILLLKIGIRKVLYFDLFIDITFTIFLAYLLKGSFAGIMAAVLGGLALSIALIISKYVFGYQKPTITWRGIRWTEVQ